MQLLTLMTQLEASAGHVSSGHPFLVGISLAICTMGT